MRAKRATMPIRNRMVSMVYSETTSQIAYEARSGDDAAATLGGDTRFGAAGVPLDGPDWGIAAKMRLGF